jgi:hypothetical protein
MGKWEEYICIVNFKGGDDMGLRAGGGDDYYIKNRATSIAIVLELDFNIDTSWEVKLHQPIYSLWGEVLYIY